MSATAYRHAFHFTNLICCPNCGQEGVEIWEDTTPFNAARLQSQLLKRSDEFYARASATDRQPAEIVCRKCGAVQPQTPP